MPACHEVQANPALPVQRSYVWLFFAGCLGTLLLLSFLLRAAFLESEKHAEAVVSQVADLLESDLEAKLQRLHADLEEIAASTPTAAMRLDAVPRFAAGLNDNLRLHARHFPEVSGYRIAAESGALLYSSEFESSRASVQGRSYFEELKADPGKTLVFSEVSLGNAGSGPMIHAATPVKGRNGEFLGIVVVGINLLNFQSRFDAMGLGERGLASLRRSDDGRLILQRPAWPETMNKLLPADPIFERVKFSSGRGQVRAVAPEDGIERLYAFRKVGEYPFYVAVGIASYDYLAVWRSTAAIALLACVAILLMLGLVMWRLRRLEVKERQLVAESRRSEATYRSLLEAAPFQIIISGAENGLVKYINRRAAQWLNAEPGEMQGRRSSELYWDPEGYERMISILKKEGVVQDFEIELQPRNGNRRWAIVSMELVEFNGDMCTFTACSDISERRAAELATIEANEKLQAQLEENHRLQAALKEQAIRDGLTGLFNRRYLDETLEREVARARRENQELSLIILDIDHFKKINDSYGHHAGDLVLKTVAARLAADVRTEDVACRYGGEEFLVLLPNMPFETAIQRANTWCRRLADLKFTFDGINLGITASFGVASYPDHARNPGHLTQFADRALYMAKRNGRNRVAACPTTAEALQDEC